MSNNPIGFRLLSLVVLIPWVYLMGCYPRKEVKPIKWSLLY